MTGSAARTGPVPALVLLIDKEPAAVPSPPTEAAIVAHVERLLDTAPAAGVELVELAAVGRRLAKRDERLRGLPRSARRAALEKLALADIEELCRAYKMLETRSGPDGRG